MKRRFYFASEARSRNDFLVAGVVQRADATLWRNLSKTLLFREVGEESGLDFRPRKLFDVYEMELDDRKVVTHLFLGDYSGNIHFDGEEVEDCQWYTLAEARKLELLNCQ
jgi:8-oxo-dGTP pyrophosphatase MutT (NUDIX family)